MNNNNQQLNPIHIEAMITSLSKQLQDANIKLADASGYIATLESNLKSLTEELNAFKEKQESSEEGE